MRFFKHTPVIQFALTPIVALTLFVLTGCRPQVTHQVSKLYLGTIINITVIADSHEKASQAAEAAFKEIGRIEALMSPVSISGDVYRINHDAARGPVEVSDETFSLLCHSKEVWERSGGAFDITFASLSQFWNFKKTPFIPPDADFLKKHLAKVDSMKMLLDAKKKTVKFTKAGMKIGLGGIAKGYAIYLAIEMLRAHGIRNAIVEAGGDLMVIGRKNGNFWRVGLAHPRQKEIVAVIELKDGQSIATSGDYERFAIYKGVRYHHIIDPKTGFPANRCVSVSVICDDPVEADAYATAFFVMGRERAFDLMKVHRNLEAIIIDPDMKIYASASLRGKIHLIREQELIWVQ